MTPEQQILVRRTTDAALASGYFAEAFYDRLFGLAPELRPIFPDDLSELRLKFMNTLATIVGTVERPAMFASIVQHLGRQHGRFGVQPAHYAPVGEALLATLDDALGEQFTPPVREAWTALYGDIARGMQRGSAEDRLAARTPTPSQVDRLPE